MKIQNIIQRYIKPNLDVLKKKINRSFKPKKKPLDYALNFIT